jgi:hypothetical protein
VRKSVRNNGKVKQKKSIDASEENNAAKDMQMKKCEG